MALALLANAIPTGAMLVVLITTLAGWLFAEPEPP
jgi:hypothetical protein